MSRPEIGCLQNNQNGIKRPDYSGVPEHRLRLPEATSQVWHQPNNYLQMGDGLSGYS